MKHEWRKHEKATYLPKAKPTLKRIPAFKYYTLEGKGNPNEPAFAEAVGVLYSLAYGVKMSPKKGIVPEGYFEFTVYPLEGIWDITEEAKEKGDFTKDDLVYKIMIRQPEFVTEEFAVENIERVKIKKPHVLLDKVQFETIEDGLSIQMLHIGPYDDEHISFDLMKSYCEANGLVRVSNQHREIYLSDATKTAPEKLKTVLRFAVDEVKCLL